MTFGYSSSQAYPVSEIYLLIAIFAIGEQKSALAKQGRMHFVTSDENAKGQGVGILHLKLPCSLSSQQRQYATPSITEPRPTQTKAWLST